MKQNIFSIITICFTTLFILLVVLLLKTKFYTTLIKRKETCNPQISKIDSTLHKISSLNIKTLLVTGGAGYIGSHMVITLLDSKNWNIILVDNLSRSTKNSIHIIKSYAKKINKLNYLHIELIDISHYTSMVHIFKKYKVDIVMHFAGNAYVAESVKYPNLYYNNITFATSELLRAMNETNVNFLIYSSSCAVYGTMESNIITEHSSPNPISPYGLAKSMAENIIIQHALTGNLQFRAIILRYFNVIGSDTQGRIGPFWVLPAHKQYSRLVDVLLNSIFENQSKTVQIFGGSFNTKDGTSVRDYIHVNDLVNAHLAAIDLLKLNNIDIFNLGLGSGYSILDIIASVNRVTGSKVQYTINEARPGEAEILIASAEKFKKFTHWNPKITTIDEMIKTSLKWYKMQK